jgi:DNA-directed RNA polymerase subunit RPC12/RpoP
MGTVTLQGYVCERCGHKWVKREATQGDPVICPKCKSPYWDRPKKQSKQFISEVARKARAKS